MSKKPARLIRPPQKVVLERLAQIPWEKRAGVSVLDVPAGAGALEILLGAAGFNVTGCDLFPEYSRALFREATGDEEGFDVRCRAALGEPLYRRLFPSGLRLPARVDVVAGDMEADLPFETDEFDIVLCVEGIEHIDPRLRLLQELRRITKPEGRVIVTTPNPLCVRGRLAFALTGQRTFKTFIDEYTEVQDVSADGTRIYHGHIFLIDYVELRCLLHHSGFKTVVPLATPVSVSSAVLLPFMLPFMLFFSVLGQRKAKKEFARLVREGRVPAGTTPPYNEILRHLFSAPLLLGSGQAIEART